MGSGPIPSDDNKMPIGKEYWNQAKKEKEQADTRWKSPTGEDYVPVGKSPKEVNRINVHNAFVEQGKNALKTLGKIVSLPFTLFVSCNIPDEEDMRPQKITEREINEQKKGMKYVIDNSIYHIKFDKENKKISFEHEKYRDLKIEFDETDIKNIKTAINKKRVIFNNSIKELKNAQKTLKNKEAINRITDGLSTQQEKLYKLEQLEGMLFNNTEGQIHLGDMLGLLNYFGIDEKYNILDQIDKYVDQKLPSPSSEE